MNLDRIRTAIEEAVFDCVKPGSLEGFIHTTTSALSQTKGDLEVVTQALLLSALLCYWVNISGKKWMNWALGVGYAICAPLPLLALVAPKL